MSRVPHRSLLAAAVALLAPACDDPGAPSADPPLAAESAAGDGHARMLAALEQAHRRFGPENRFLGDAELRFLERRLESLAPRGSAAPALERCRLLVEVGGHELRLGRTAAALERFAAAEALLDDLRPHERSAAAPHVWMSRAVAFLRQGEDENCVRCTDGAGCKFPIGPEGVHDDPTGSESAVPYLVRAATAEGADEDTRVRARWLLNIACMTLGGPPDGVPPGLVVDPATFRSEAAFPRFRNVAFERGVATLNHCGAALIDDLDGDGAFDLLTCGFELDGSMRLFRGGGDGTFEDRTEECGLAGFPGGLNMVHADVEDDGDLDVYVLRGAWLERKGRIPNSLLLNDGAGRFRDGTFAAGLGERHEPTQTAAFADVDNDGDLDLYVGNEEAASQLFENDGAGSFTDVAEEAGVTNRRYAKAAVFGDVDADGFPDLYVSNHLGRNRLYANRGDGTFADVAEERGVDGPIRSFPAWFFDFDEDGALDLYVASYVEDLAEVARSLFDEGHVGERARLYRGDGRGGFEDVAAAAGLTRLAPAMGANFGDLDGDGWLDFYLGTGWPSYEALVPNVMLRNRGDGTFEDVSEAGGFGHLQKGHAVVFADVDGDGDQDVFEQMGGAYGGDAFHDALYENPGCGRHWLGVELVGVTSNRSAIGARVRVDVTVGGATRAIHRHVGSGGSFGANPLRCHFGLGDATRVDRLVVTWPASGRTQVFEGLDVDRVLTIREDQDEL